MINIFRKIRQGLLSNIVSKGGPGRYLLYAVGEIVLVVIGILIALSIHNWNDHRKASLKKNILLKSLYIEFSQNLEQLDSILKYDRQVVKSSLEFLKLKHDDSILNNEYYMRQLMQNTSWNWTFDPINGALHSGISSGDINLIEIESLTDMLFGWKDVVADARENEERALRT